MVMLTPNEVFRDHEVLGDENSPLWEPYKPEIRALLNQFRAPRDAAFQVYVRQADGDDDGTGAADAAGVAFATIARAREYVMRSFDLSRQAVTINCRGTFDEKCIWNGVAIGDAGQAITIQATTGDPADFVIDISTAGTCWKTQYFATVTLKDFTVKADHSNGLGVQSIWGGQTFMVNPVFDKCDLHMFVTRQGYMEINGDYAVTGCFGSGTARHIEATHHGNWRWTGVGQTCTVTGTLPMLYWVNVQSLADLTITNTVVSTVSFDVSGATVTGLRYNCIGAGHIQWAGPMGGSHTAFPGDTAGFVDAHSVIWFGETIPSMLVLTTTFDLATTGALALTGSGFKPSSFLLFACVNNAARASWGAHGFGTGFMRWDHGITANAFTAGGTSVYFLVTDSGNFANGVVASLDADGLTLTRSKTGTPTGTGTLVAVLFAK